MAKSKATAGALLLQLKNLEREAEEGENLSIAVGYEAEYAMWVHELVDMVLQGEPRPSGKGVYWGPSGQAKFLEEPARRLRREMADIIVKSMSTDRRRGDLEYAMLLAARYLLRESQKLVPVEYGDLKKSGFATVV